MSPGGGRAYNERLEEPVMVSERFGSMGRFWVEIDLENDKDLARASEGDISPDQVRRETIRGVVDSGATRLVIPEGLAQRLGLELAGTERVRYADGHTAERSLVQRV